MGVSWIMFAFSHPCAPWTRSGVVIVTVPVEDSRAVMAHRGVAVKGEEHVSFLTQLAHKAFRLAPLTVQFDVLGEGGVDLGQGAAEAAAGDVNQVLERVHVVVLHKVLPVMQL